MSVLSGSRLRATVIASVMVFGFMASHVQAQDQVARVRVVVPFDFTDGSRQFKAGTYTIGTLNQSVALIHGESNSGMAAIHVTMDIHPAEEGKVVFHKYGDRYYISDVFSAGRLDHLHIVTSTDEKKVIRSVGERVRDQQTLAIVHMPR